MNYDLSIEKRAANVKSQMDAFFLDHAKSAILKQINSSGNSFVLGEFPYWKAESEFSDEVKLSHNLYFDDIVHREGCIVATLLFTSRMGDEIYDQYNISPIFEIYAYEPQDEDEVDQRVIFESEKDFSKIISFETKYVSLYDEEQISNVEKLIDDFKKILFLAALKN